jgi:hypothetical protein
MSFILLGLSRTTSRVIAINTKTVSSVGDVAIIVNKQGIPVEINPNFRLVYKFPFRFQVIYKPESPQEQDLGTF